MSSYVQSVLGPGEQVQYEAKVSIWSMMPLFILGLILLPVYGLGLLFWLVAYIRYISTELAITNKKIIAKFGFIKRDTIELLLPKVESIQVNQSIFGRMLNYGSIVVSGAGNPQAPVPGISNPIHFRKRFMEIQEQLSAKA
jgi:uncharacterized membrane protein YdbT with pleckstrin-like domain